MHDIAAVAEVKNIRPIEGKDKIVLAKICNFDVAVSKEDFREGDLCVYVFMDSILPEGKPEFEFLRKRCYSPKEKGFVIGAMKFGDIVSEGIAFPLFILPGGDYRNGQDVSGLLGARKPAENGQWKKPKWASIPILGKLFCRGLRNFPSWVHKTDQENLEMLGDIEFDQESQPASHWWLDVTEKLEGTPASYICDRGRFWVCSASQGTNTGPWQEFADKAGIKRKMKAYCRKKGIKRLCIQGELVGPKVQKNVYGLKELDYYVFGGWIGDGHKSGRRLTVDEYEEAAKAMGLKTVPFLNKWGNIHSLEDALKECQGTSRLAEVPREGIVVRSYDGNLSFKVKSREYKAWFSKKK